MSITLYAEPDIVVEGTLKQNEQFAEATDFILNKQMCLSFGTGFIMDVHCDGRTIPRIENHSALYIIMNVAHALIVSPSINLTDASYRTEWGSCMLTYHWLRLCQGKKSIYHRYGYEYMRAKHCDFVDLLPQESMSDIMHMFQYNAGLLYEPGIVVKDWVEEQYANHRYIDIASFRCLFTKNNVQTQYQQLLHPFIDYLHDMVYLVCHRPTTIFTK